MIYVARYCQAAGKGENVIRPVDGDAGITPLGIQQSKLLGKRLKELKFKGPIYASPYYRTVATACYAASTAQDQVAVPVTTPATVPRTNCSGCKTALALAI